MKRVTLKDIAQQADVSISTVSLALRGHPRIPQETVDRIKELAASMGYAPDPWLSSLSSYRSKTDVGERNTTIAVITNWETKAAWRSNETIMNYWNGALGMAEQMGYKLEEFWMPELGGEERTRSILYNRGIKAILLLPQPPEVDRMSFDFSDFSVTQVGRTLHWPIVNTVTHDHYGAMHLAGFHLNRMNYKRIGLAVTEGANRVHRWRWVASYLAKQYELSASMEMHPYMPQQMEKGSFLDWLKESRCDVVVSNEFAPYAFMKEVGMRVPDDIGFCCLCLEGRSDISGIQMKSEFSGAQAVSLLHMETMNRELGCPENPMTHLIEGSWNPGSTIREQ
ncbi:LacI family DNA-binding transcriptional regulator [Rubellicoccus peritrichatus]|uniref:LacI family DNA-binding transcriptional regulator n=1 Tax=Rubellicoccus peritrichatus TaxID=3080537 RepID=A0AAQ3L8E5_9BACT|nr:LacI family DNA-binding transcriptional regulator [Puniceicoccus sp. CR14]WOO41001.1 LacI family DNA-binding transcriptional regulator [Puniceicoccus sp. CR14]